MSLQPLTRSRLWRCAPPALAAGWCMMLSAGEIKAAPMAANAPAKYALLVGINAYPNPDEALHGCVNDAKRLRRLNRWAACRK